MYKDVVRTKFAIPVRLTLADGQILNGVFYISVGERILDLLCDGRPFIPFNTTEGMSILNKSSMSRIDIVSLDELRADPSPFPDVDIDYMENNRF
ncbi:hypothetical protein EV663_10789 [Rhodovulum bhavnagarense]|uniref:Uncharacterized protein n=1 Tax=Rhodovulum bhavnagarense TaxID=992286 RepID=A0A4R2REE1_9RHOB|nr:hypothetical protein [Rhodovulum bhavnagarense]TCP60914.1 hypothetical protein EV663_10789 [Rhodovulum bhavnagarense]